jgi:hypothetical protein
VKLLFDEDTGRGIPEALRALELPDASIDYVRRVFRKRIQRGEFPDGVKDEDWMPFAGRGGWLVFSCNKHLLDADAQREMWIRENVGGVFLTTGEEKKREVMLLILKKWDWLETIAKHEPRPFAILMTLTGKTKRDPRVPPARPQLLPASKG